MPTENHQKENNDPNYSKGLIALHWLQETASYQALSMKLDHLIWYLMSWALQGSIEAFHVNSSFPPKAI